MKQYLDLLKQIKEKGSYKEPAREGMPGTTSLFGYQFRHNLQDGFPLLTTKKMYWKGVVIELLWFLRGNTNIKYLVDNGVNIWNEDAYNYYEKLCKRDNLIEHMDFKDFIFSIKDPDNGYQSTYNLPNNYTLGDCSFQYGKVWRNWERFDDGDVEGYHKLPNIDQIKNVIRSIKSNPYGRRHLVTAIDPAHENDLALYWCHAMFQFNCRKLSIFDKENYLHKEYNPDHPTLVKYRTKIRGLHKDKIEEWFNVVKIPKYYLDCQLYQRSADVFLGVPFNIASYALLTHIIAKICNMVSGEFIHSFGDVHIYDNHMEAVDEQLKRESKELPKLNITVNTKYWMSYELGEIDFDKFINSFDYTDFTLENYNPDPSIKAKLSTGLKK